jgi:hypothetical protein
MSYRVCIFSIKIFGVRLLLTNAWFIALIVLDPALFIAIGLVAGSAMLIDKEML